MVLGFTLLSEAQVKTPSLSPLTKISQEVGLTNFNIEYSRPSLKGRDMHKDIIPYGLPWRFGANKSTVISFDTSIKFGGINLDAGSYALFAVPSKKEWEIIIYSDTDGRGVPNELDKSKVAGTITLPVKNQKDKVETFTFSFVNLSVSNFDLKVEWENTSLLIPVELPTIPLTLNSINKDLNENSSDEEYLNAAMFLMSNDLEWERSLEYMNIALDKLEDPAVSFYYYHNKAIILQKLNKKDEAIQMAKKSLELAEQINREEYIRKNKILLKELGVK